MTFEVIRQKKPSYSAVAMVALLLLSGALLGIAVGFAYLLVSGTGNDYMIGTLLSLEFLIAGVEIVLYAKCFVGFREVSEDREEKLLW